MAIQCPYCMHLMELKGAKPGRFKPRCASCKRKFALMIPDNESETPVVEMIPQTVAKRDERLPDDITAALGIEKTPAPELKPKAKRAAPSAAAATSSASATTPPPAVARSSSSSVTLPPTELPGAQSSSSSSADSSITAPPAVVSSMRIPTGADVTTAPGSAMPTMPDRAETLDLQGHTQAAADAGADSPADENGELHGTLGGYQVLKRLGKGGMGAVYLAKQLSLQRNVAMKVLLEQLAEDPQFIARFTREAYAAAQLTHHNMVQIHDIGAQRRTHFFSMEFVEGQTLSQLIRDQGRIDPEVAVGYALQAARGLKFAHDHGMVHRDVKPENLMLNVHGIVKVADLGLVKTADGAKESEAARAKAAAASGNWYETQTTQLNISMGTPAYMPPEQATDAANVDHRADIYSLGCTLYAMLVGRPPFTGKTAMDVITKHMKEPVTPPSVLDDHIPESLSVIVQRMVAKRPQDRYQTMGEVIEALEGFLGTDSTGPFSPSEEQVRNLESCVSWFNGSSWARRRAWLIRAFVPLSVLLLAVALFVPSGFESKVQWTGGVLGFVILTPLIYLLISGATQKTHLMLKVRELVFGSRFIDWLTWIVGAALVFGVLVALDWHLMWLGFALAAAIVAGAFHFLIDPMVARQRVDPVLQAEALLKKMRFRAVPEAALQQFVCKYAGEHWEAFYEELFGYESKMLAREKWGKSATVGAKSATKGDKGRPRPKYAAWRDPIIAWIDEKQKSRREAKERKHIARLELASLKAKGYSDTAARKKAERVAETLVMKAAEMREDARAAAMETTPPPPKPDEKKPEEKPQEAAATEEAAKKRKKMLEDEGLEGYEHLSYFQRRYGGWAGLFLGPSVRFLLGAVLLTGCILWVKQNEIVTPHRLSEFTTTMKEQSTNVVDGMSAQQIVDSARSTVQTKDSYKPLDLPMVPGFLTSLFNGWTPGIAGGMLVLSAFFSGPSLGLFLVPAALITFLGARYGVPALGPVSAEFVATTIGLVLATIGFMFARK